jgi:transcriptional regulator with XRE-family HTH domain
MSEFNKDYLENFLGTVRKYMQVRGSLSQKELAELTETGVSTMSRFLNQKTTELNPQLLAKIVAKLNIPLHEIIDFVEEDYADRFIRLVKFYKDEIEELETPGLGSEKNIEKGEAGAKTGDEFIDGLSDLGTAKKSAKARVSAGGKKRTLVFEPDNDAKNSELSIKEKLELLSPRQKAYLTDFLNLDGEGRDLMVDVGNSLFRYLRHKGMEF